MSVTRHSAKFEIVYLKETGLRTLYGSLIKGKETRLVCVMVVARVAVCVTAGTDVGEIEASD
jgi:hypothetical protein